jgi:hypothetical protein
MMIEKFGIDITDILKFENTPLDKKLEFYKNILSI